MDKKRKLLSKKDNKKLKIIIPLKTRQILRPKLYK